MVVLLNYFIKTHNQIKASRSEEELSNSIRNIDKEIKSIEKQLALISGSYSSFKNIKEEYGSFLSQLFDIKRDYQYYATEIQKFRKISAAMEQSSTSRSKNKDTNYSEYFISQLEEVINTGLSNLTRITSQSEGSDIKGYVSKHKECKKMFEAQLKSYMKEEGSTLSSMKNMFFGQSEPENKREKQFESLRPLYDECIVMIKTLLSLFEENNLEEFENAYFKSLKKGKAKHDYESFSEKKMIGNLDLPKSLKSKTEKLLNDLYSKEKMLTETQEAIKSELQSIYPLISLFNSIFRNFSEGQEILDKGSKSDMRRCMYSIQSDYEKISKKPLKFNNTYDANSSIIKTSKALKEELARSHQPEEYEDLGDEEDLVMPSHKSVKYKQHSKFV